MILRQLLWSSRDFRGRDEGSTTWILAGAVIGSQNLAELGYCFRSSYLKGLLIIKI